MFKVMRLPEEEKAAIGKVMSDWDKLRTWLKKVTDAETVRKHLSWELAGPCRATPLTRMAAKLSVLESKENEAAIQAALDDRQSDTVVVKAPAKKTSPETPKAKAKKAKK